MNKLDLDSYKSWLWHTKHCLHKIVDYINALGAQSEFNVHTECLPLPKMIIHCILKYLY